MNIDSKVLNKFLTRLRLRGLKGISIMAKKYPEAIPLMSMYFYGYGDALININEMIVDFNTWDSSLSHISLSTVIGMFMSTNFGLINKGLHKLHELAPHDDDDDDDTDDDDDDGDEPYVKKKLSLAQKQRVRSPVRTSITPLPRHTEPGILGPIPTIPTPQSLNVQLKSPIVKSQQKLPPPPLVYPIVQPQQPQPIRVIGRGVITNQSLIHHDQNIETFAGNTNNRNVVPTQQSLVHHDTLATTTVAPVTTIHPRQFEPNIQPHFDVQPQAVIVDPNTANMTKITQNLKHALGEYIMAFRGTKNLTLALDMLENRETLDETIGLLIKTVDGGINQTITSFETIHTSGQRGLIISFKYRGQEWLVIMSNTVYVNNRQLNATLMQQITDTFPGVNNIRYHRQASTIPIVFYRRVLQYRPNADKPFATLFEVT